MTTDYDVIVVGAGPAGAAAAGILGRSGARVLLLDKASFPRDKPCGEGILPNGVAVLRRLGALGAVRSLGVRFRGLRYWSASGECAEAEFPPSQDGPAFGIAIRRTRLDAELLGWALACPGVRFEERVLADASILRDGRMIGVTARGRRGARARWTAPLTVIAEGLHSILRRRLGVQVRWPRRRRFGAVGHLDRVEGPCHRVEIFLAPGFEVYMTPAGEGVSVALLLEERLLAALTANGRPSGLWDLLRRVPALFPRLADSRLVSPVLLWGPLGPELDRAHGEGFLLLGDSAGAPDPITGEGISLALTLAERVRPLLLDGIAQGGAARALAAYEALRREASADAFTLGRWLLSLSRRQWLAQRVVRGLRRSPQVFEKLLGVACGEAPLAALTWTDRLRIVL